MAGQRDADQQGHRPAGLQRLDDQRRRCGRRERGPHPGQHRRGRLRDRHEPGLRPRLNDGQWHHLVWTRSADGVNSLYVDGRLADQAEDGGGAISNDRPIQIGGDPHQRGTFLDGALAELAIYAAVRARIASARMPWLADWPCRRRTRQLGPAAPLEVARVGERGGPAWELQRGEQGWSLGQISLRGKPLERPATAGVLTLRDVKTGDVRLAARRPSRTLGPSAARLTGQAQIGDATLRFQRELTCRTTCPRPPGPPTGPWTATWTAGRSPGSLGPFRPLAGGAGSIRSPATARRSTSRRCATAASRRRWSIGPTCRLVALFGMDPASDYLHPNNWTGPTSFHFRSGQTAPSSASAAASSRPGPATACRCNCSSATRASRPRRSSQLVNGWMQLNRYAVQPLQVRTPDEALAIFVAGRRANRMWQPGKGYQIQDAWPVIYVPESPINAYLDYLLYEQTGDRCGATGRSRSWTS